MTPDQYLQIAEQQGKRNMTITIATNTKPNALRTIRFLALQVGVIYLGVLAESQAMQWSGFAILVFVLLAVGITGARADTGLTIAEARQRLDEIEREEVGQ